LRSGYAPTELQEVVMEDSHIAGALCAELAERIGPERFDLWFGAQTRLCVDERRLTVRATNAFVRDWLKKHFSDDIRASWEAVVGGPLPIEFDIQPALTSVPETPQIPILVTTATVGTGTIAQRPAVSTADDAAQFVDVTVNRNQSRGTFSFATFVVGPSNEYAFRAIDLTARGRQQASPVFVWGSTGVGKTHLLRAMVREYRRHHPRSAAVYLSAEQFTTGYVDAIRGSGLPSFRQKCRGAELFVIDDLQFLVGKQRTLEELQYTMDYLLNECRQLVLGSDRSLAELHALGVEMTSRLSSGLVCQIEPPEFATRLSIVHGLSREMGLAVGDDVLRTIAAQIAAGARELRGALCRLQAMSDAHEQPISRDLADRTIADLMRHTTRSVRLGDVQKAVCEVFGVEPAQLRSDRKGRSVSEPRMLAMWLARKYTRAAWSEIGEFFGRRSHSTVIAAHRRVERLISTQADIGLHDRPCSVEDAIRRLEQALRTA
jgi:chromosomal replication initiator protein